MNKKAYFFIAVLVLASCIGIGAAVNQADNSKKLEIQSDNSKAQAVQQPTYKSNNNVDRFALMRNRANNMLRQMDLMFNDPFFDNNFMITTPNLISSSGFNSSSPGVTFSENVKDYIVQVITPGMDKNDLSVNVKNDVLTVSGRSDIQSETNDDSKSISKQQIISNFSQSFSLPENIDIDKIFSEYKNGVLKITIPKDMKKIKENTKTITIQ